MSIIGHPDFQDIVEWEGGALVNDTSTVPSGVGLEFGPFNTKSWHNYLGNFYSDTQRALFWLSWYEDEAMTDLIARKEYHCGANKQGVVLGTHLGPWLRISSFVGADNSQLEQKWRSTNRQWNKASHVDAPTLVNYFAQTIAAGATRTDEFIYFFEGKAFLSLTTTAAAFQVVVDGFDYQGNRIRIAYSEDEPSLHDGVDLVIPPLDCRVQVTNNDASNRTFTLSIIPTEY